jgi:hypothetical protein
MLFPSTKQETTAARSSVLNLFMLLLCLTGQAYASFIFQKNESCPNSELSLWRAGKRPRFLQTRRQYVTVCIAAICNGIDNQTIVGASDRMITSGDVEFELVGRSVAQRPILKALKISDTIGVMTAGDAGFQADAILDLARRLDGNQHPSVRHVATLYLDFVNEAKSRAVTNRILSPLGLSADTFISRQREMNNDFVQRITSEILRVELGAETIFAGLDGRERTFIRLTNMDFSVRIPSRLQLLATALGMQNRSSCWPNTAGTLQRGRQFS